jgi:hypothetical protein
MGGKKKKESGGKKNPEVLKTDTKQHYTVPFPL